MRATNDFELLDEFANRRSESAFRALVERHLPLVFGTARRVTRNPALAEEIAQTVFVLLARKAKDLPRHAVLSGWLFRTTRFVSARAIRGEERRRMREERAVSMHLRESSTPNHDTIVAELDEALARLGEADRQALFLRYFEGRASAEVARALGIGEEAAKKRITRALDKLRGLLGRRGVVVSATALAAALTTEAAVPVPEATAERVLSRLASASKTLVASDLLSEVLRALWWSKLKATLGVLLIVIGAGVLISFALPKRDQLGVEQRAEQRIVSTSAPSLALAASPADENHIEAGGLRLTLKELRIRVLDAVTAAPIAGAELSDSLRGSAFRTSQAEALKTAQDGWAQLKIPEDIPGYSQDFKQFQVFIKAAEYAPRDIMWLSSTGGVFRTVQGEYTVHLAHGTTVRGTIVDDLGKPLPNVRVNAFGNNYAGYSYSLGPDGKVISDPVVRAEDFSSFSVSGETDSSVNATDSQGRFALRNFPSDLQKVMFEFITPEGAHHKFTTPEGTRLTSEKLPSITIAELRNGTARIVLERGIDLSGKVVGPIGEAIPGAQVIEARMMGNLQILSRNQTDARGEFRLPNRKPREVLLAASAAGYASLSTLIRPEPEQRPIVLQLPPELPLRGRVQDPDGQPLAGAELRLLDYRNDGLAFEWKTTTGTDGRFDWQGAPTNELVLYVSASGFLPRLERLRANGEEHVVTLRQGDPDTLRLTGQVRDAESGEPIDYFQVKLHSSDRGDLPTYLHSTSEGRLGLFDFEVDLRDKQIEREAALLLVIEADGYETLLSKPFFCLEGNRNFALEMRKGGTVQGTVISPDGAPAAGCSVAIGQVNDPVLAGRNGEFTRKASGKTDASGHFSVRPLVKAAAMIFFHPSGWAIRPLNAPATDWTVQLKPWARLEVQMSSDLSAHPGDGVEVRSLRMDAPQSLHVLYSQQLGEKRSLIFDRVPAGEFIISFNPSSAQRYSPSWVETLQTNVAIAAGETQTLLLGAGGQTVIAQLKLGKGGSDRRISAFLRRNVALPPDGFEYFATHRSMEEANRGRFSDPVFLAARRAERSYFGEVNAEGLITFRGVLPGEYVLELREFGPLKPDSGVEPQVIAQLKSPVEVSPVENSGEVQNLGEFLVE